MDTLSVNAPADRLSQQFMLHGFDPSTVLDGELDIQALDAFSVLCNLTPPSVPYLAEREKEDLGWRKVEPHHDAIQIHYVANHYVVVHHRNGIITIYDSLYNPQRINQMLPQLNILYTTLANNPNPFANIQYVVTQSQGSTADCGLFAAANAHLLLTGTNPQDVLLQQGALRQHLYQCLIRRSITPFPHTPRSVTQERPDKSTQYSKKTSYADIVKSNRAQEMRQEYLYKKILAAATEQPSKQQHQQPSAKSVYQFRKEGDRLRKQCARQRIEQRVNESDLKKTETYRLGRKLHMAQQRQRSEKRIKESAAKKTDDYRQRMKKHMEQQRQSSEIRMKESAAKKTDDYRHKMKEHKQQQRQSSEVQMKESAAKKTDDYRHKMKEHMKQQRQSSKIRMKESAAKKTDDYRHKMKEHKQLQRKSSEVQMKESAAKKTDDYRHKMKEHKQQLRKSSEIRMKESAAKKTDDYRHKMKEQKQQQRQSFKVQMKESAAKKTDDYRHKMKEHKQLQRKSSEEKRKESAAKKTDDYRHKMKEHKQQLRKSSEIRKKESHAKKTDSYRRLRQEYMQKSRDGKQQKKKDPEFMIESFHKSCHEMPNFICCICYRFCFRKQVTGLNIEKYDCKDLVRHCIVDRAKHATTDVCEKSCPLCREWICRTCNQHFQNGKMPNQAFMNNLGLPQLPECLQNLNQLEKHLISPMIPFMKIMTLPKGLQKGIHGPVVCVPSDVPQVTSTLPRPLNDETIVKVKLKRKMEYKGHHLYQKVTINNIHAAIHYLHQSNPHYQGKFSIVFLIQP